MGPNKVSRTLLAATRCAAIVQAAQECVLTMPKDLEDMMSSLMAGDRPGSGVEGVTTGLRPTNQKKQSRKNRVSRELLGTSEFTDKNMDEGSDGFGEDSERGDPSPDPYRSSIHLEGARAARAAREAELRSDVLVKRVGGDVTIVRMPATNSTCF